MTTRPSLKKTVVAGILLLLTVGWIIHVGWQWHLANQLESFGAEITFERTVPTGVNFQRGHSTFSNEQMPMVARLPHLHWLDLTETQVTDEGLQHVERLPHLESLSVHVNQISTERDRRLSKRIGITKIRVIDGRRVVDGFE